VGIGTKRIGILERWNNGMVGLSILVSAQDFLVPIFHYSFFSSSVLLFCKVFKFDWAYFGGTPLSEIPPTALKL
jgi:hypothetical protein